MIVVVGEAHKHEAVNSCLGKHVMSEDNVSVPLLFAKEIGSGCEIEASFCSAAEATKRLKAALFITDDTAFQAKFGSIEQLLINCRTRFYELASPHLQGSLPELLKLLDNACLSEAGKSEARQRLFSQIQTIKYELTAIKKRKRRGSSLLMKRDVQEGGVSPYATSRTRRTAYLNGKLEERKAEMEKLNKRLELLPLGDVLEYIKVSGAYACEVLCSPSAANISMAAVGRSVISSIVFCSFQPASQTATDQMARRLLGILACIPIQHFPSIINFAQHYNSIDQSMWRDRIRSSILRLMVFMVGSADARICALADCAYNTADIIGPQDNFERLVQVQEDKKESEITFEDYDAESDKIKLHLLIMQESIIIDRLEQRLNNTVRTYNNQLLAANIYYVNCEGEFTKLNHSACLMRALPDIVSTTQAVMADMMCEIITRALPDVHSRLPPTLRWKFTFDAECTPPSVAAEIDQAVRAIVTNNNLQEAVKESAQKILATDFSYFSVRKCAGSLAQVVLAGLAEILELVDIRRSTIMGWTPPNTASADTLATSAAAAVAASASVLSLNGPFLKRSVMETQSSWTYLVPSGEAELDAFTTKDRVLSIDTESERWTVGAKAHASLLALGNTARIRASSDCLNKPFSILAAAGVVEREKTCFFVPKGVFTIVFCSSQEVLDSIYDENDVDRAYCIIPPLASVRHCMLSLCDAYNLPYFLRMPLVSCHMSLFYETISPPMLPLRRLPLHDPCIAIKQMARLLEWLGSECDGVLFGDFACSVVSAKDALLFGVINAKTFSSVFVSNCFNFL